MVVDKQVTIRLEARDELTPALRRAAAEAKSLAGATDKTSSSLARLSTSRSGLAGVAADAGRVQARMLSAQAATARFSAAAAGAGRAASFRGVAADAGRASNAMVSLSGATDRVARSSRDARGGFDALSPGLAAVGLGVAAAAKSFMDFDANMSAVSASTGATGATLDSLRAKAIELGSATQYSGAEAAAGINELAKAGVDTQSILGGGLQGALSLAAAGQMGVADAAETAASAMTQFGLSGGSVTHIADLLAKGANIAKGSVADMGAALNQTGLVASQTGLSIEETVGGLTAFAKAGMTGSDAGTSMKTMLLQLTPSSQEAAAAMKDVGFTAYDAQGNFVGLEETTRRLKAATAGMTDEQQQLWVKTVFGQDAIRGVNALMKQGVQDVNEYGFANKTAAALTDNLRGDIERLGGAIDSVILSGGGSVNGVLRSWTQGLEGVVTAVGAIPGPVLQVGAALVAMNTASRFLPDLGPRFAAARDAAAGFRVELAAQRSGMAGMSGAARELGLSVGQVATLSGASTAKVGGLTAAFRAAGGATGVLKSAATGLVGVLGGPWGIALAGASVALSIFGQRSAEAKARQDELKSAADALTGTLVESSGAWSQQATAQITSMASQRNVFANFQNMGYSIRDTTIAMTQQGPVRDRILGQLDAEIARLTEAGRTYTQYGAAGANTNQRLIDYYTQQRQSLTDLIGVGSQAATLARAQAEANSAAADAARDTASGTTQMGAALKDASDAAKAANEALLGLADTVTQGRNAQATYWETVEATRKKLGELSGAVVRGGADFDLQTARGRNAQKALLDLGNAGRAAAIAQVDLSGDTRQASAQMAGARTRFLAAAKSMGLNTSAANRLADQLGLTSAAVRNHVTQLGRIPASVTTRVSVTGIGAIDDAIGRVRTLQRTINQATGGGGLAFGFANGGIINRYADGGVRERHVAQIARAGAWRVWAEDETGGEAYIPLAASKRARSVSILEEVARRFGLAVTKQARGSILSFAGGGTTVPVRGGASGDVTSVNARGVTIPVTAQVTKVIVPRGVTAPFLYTPGGKWDRSGTLAEVALNSVVDVFKKLYVSPAQLAEAQSKLGQARESFAKSGGTVAGYGGRTATAAGARMVGALASAPAQIRSLISATAARYGVSANLVASIVKAESGFKTNAKSGAGAVGLMQLMPGTAKALGVKDRSNAAQNLEGGVKYLSQLLAKFKGDVAKALAAYNAGPGRVLSGRALPKETRSYVSKVLADPGVRAAGSSAGTSARGAAAQGKAAGAAVAASQKTMARSMAATVRSKTDPATARAAAIANALSMNGRGSYKWGGGHTSTYYKNSAALAADCSGFVGWAIGHALGRNATSTAKGILSGNKSLGYVKIDPKIAAKTAGALMGNAGHIVMSLGDGRVIESYSKGKPVRIRQLAPRDYKMASWNTRLGPMSQATAAQITGGLTGTATAGGSGGGATAGPDAGDIRDYAQAQAEYAKALAASKIPARTQFATATVQATKYSAQFLGNIRKIRDRGFPEVAARLLEMGEEDGAAVAASFATGSDKDLRNTRANLAKNAAYTQMAKDLQASLSSYSGPPAWQTAVRETTTSNAKWKGFLDYIDKLRTQGFGTLAARLLEMGVDDGYDIARQAVALDAKGRRNLRDTLASGPDKLQERQDAMSKTLLGPLWLQHTQAVVKGTAASAGFLANIRTIRDRGFSSLALKLMEMGEEAASGMAAEAAKASSSDMSKFQGDLTASEAMAKQADALLDQLRGIGQVLNISVGQTTGSDPAIRYTAPRAVDARPVPVQYLTGPQGGTTGQSGPLMVVQNMYAANPSEAATAMETRLGDAVAVSGIGRVA